MYSTNEEIVAKIEAYFEALSISSHKNGKNGKNGIALERNYIE
jgi:hypothetical protein